MPTHDQRLDRLACLWQRPSGEPSRMDLARLTPAEGEELASIAARVRMIPGTPQRDFSALSDDEVERAADLTLKAMEGSR